MKFPYIVMLSFVFYTESKIMMNTKTLVILFIEDWWKLECVSFLNKTEKWQSIKWKEYILDKFLIINKFINGIFFSCPLSYQWLETTILKLNTKLHSEFSLFCFLPVHWGFPEKLNIINKHISPFVSGIWSREIIRHALQKS